MGRLRELRRGRRWRQQNYHGADTGAEEGAELEAAKVAWVDTGAEEGWRWWQQKYHGAVTGAEKGR